MLKGPHVWYIVINLKQSDVCEKTDSLFGFLILCTEHFLKENSI